MYAKQDINYQPAQGYSVLNQEGAIEKGHFNKFL